VSDDKQGISPDDSSLLAYQDTVDSFSQWCETNLFELKMFKTNELVIDSRRNDHDVEPVKVNGRSVEVVDSFKYLGLTFDSKLSFHQPITKTQRRSHQRLYILR